MEPVGADANLGRERVGAAPPQAPAPRAIGIDGQTRWTLVFLTAIVLVCLVAWGGGKLACNYHPVHAERFKSAPLDKRTTGSKDAALAYHHAVFVQDWEVAAELVSEQGRSLFEARRAACDAACVAEQPDREARAATRAVLYRTRGPSAWVKAETFYGDRVEAQSYELQREEGRWRVVGYSEPPPPEPPGVSFPPGSPHGFNPHGMPRTSDAPQ